MTSSTPHMMSVQQSQQIAGRIRLLLQTPVVTAAAPPPSTLPPSGAISPIPFGQINQFPQSSSSMNNVANHFSPSLPIILAVLFSAFFSIGFFSLYVRRRDNAVAAATSAAAAASSDGRIPLSHSGRVHQDHPYHGVDPEFLRALPLVAYSSAKKKGTNVECAVCLIEFEEQEPLRQLPACKHIFHQDCIDMWLFSHSTCPLCRRNITTATGSMSFRWGGSGSFRHLLSRGGSTARSLPPTSEDAGTMSLIESNISNTTMETCRPCSAGVTNASPGRHPFAAGIYHGNMHAFAGIGGARRQPQMHLARVNSTGHSLQMGSANEGNAPTLCVGILSVSGGSDGDSTHRSGLYRSISELPEHRRDYEW